MQDGQLILVVDDTPANLEVVAEALSDAQFEVAIATDGERAIKQAILSQPELILLDVMMPGIDGFETCRRLKSSATTAEIPIIFMTALADVTDKVTGLNLGAVDYLTKPFQEAELLARVTTQLKLRHLTKTLEQQVEQRTHELQIALEQLQKSQLQIVQSEKMAVLGQLVAGWPTKSTIPTKPIGKGTGMGMFISYQIVTERHKGQLHFVSTPDQGTVFTIQIPLIQGGVGED
jgi:DNA-binding response OmpR family regulator